MVHIQSRYSSKFWFLHILLVGLFVSCQSDDQIVPEGFEIHPDFHLELVASEPLVFDPVDMDFDEKGRAFVLEMPGYPLRDEDSRLVLLLDNNNDGFYDERKVYADGLGVASSFMPYKQGMLVAAPPHLLWLPDEDQNDEADEHVVLMSGFSAGNLQHNFNGLTYGLDNWIYAANGGNSGQPYFVSDSSIVDLREEDFKFKLDPEVLVRIGASSGGFELAFDDYGHMFETHNLEHISHLVFEGRYIEDLPLHIPHSLSNVSDHEEDGLSRIYPIGEQETRVNHPEQSGYFSGSCGVTFYGGGTFPNGFNDQLFVADCVLNLVHIDLLSPNEASFKTSRARDKVEFLASSDRAFRPVNMTTGPDGSFYLMDMYRDVIEHPEWIPDEMESEMDLFAGRKKGRIYRIQPKQAWKGKVPVLDRSNPEELVKALGHTNQWVRLTAQRLLVESNHDSATELIQSSIEDSEASLFNLHGLWTLEGLGAMDEETLLVGLNHPNEGVRENAIKIAESYLPQWPKVTSSLFQKLSDPSPRVRMQGALTLSTLDPNSYDDFDPTWKSRISEWLMRSTTDKWESAAAVAFSAPHAHAMAKLLLNDQNTELPPAGQDFINALSALIGEGGPSPVLVDWLQSLVQINPSSETLNPILESINNGLSSLQSGSHPGENLNDIQTELTKLEEGANVPVTRAIVEMRNLLGLGLTNRTQAMLDEAQLVVYNSEQPVEIRLEYLEFLSLGSYDSRRGILFDLLDNRQPVQLQKESLRQLWESNDPKIGERLVEKWNVLGPDARKTASDILLYKKAHHDALLTGLEDGQINIGEMNFDLERRRTLLRWTDDERTKQRASLLFSDVGVVTRREVLQEMTPAIDLEGASERGATVFDQLCSQCHVYGSTGVDVGPVLTEIRRKSKQSLLHDILDPNAAVDTKYINHQLETSDGTIHVGIIDSETDNEVTIKKLGGQTVTISKENVQNLRSLGTSMMMEGLEANMEIQDMADLLTFLQEAS